MFRNQINLFAMAVIFLTVGWSVAAGADFSGSWILDKDKSDTGNPRMGEVDVTLAIEQSEGSLKIAQTYSRGGQDRTMNYTLVTDGKTENTVASPFGESKNVAVWEGDSLVVTGTQSMGGAPGGGRQGRGGAERPGAGSDRRPGGTGGRAMEVKVTETWTLSEDGSALTQTRELQTPRGSRTIKMFFNKQ